MSIRTKNKKKPADRHRIHSRALVIDNDMRIKRSRFILSVGETGFFMLMIRSEQFHLRDVRVHPFERTRVVVPEIGGLDRLYRLDDLLAGVCRMT